MTPHIAMTPYMMESLVLWGLVATTAMAAILQLSQGLGLSRMSLTFLMGSAFSGDRTMATILGFVFTLLEVGSLHSCTFFSLPVSEFIRGGWVPFSGSSTARFCSFASSRYSRSSTPEWRRNTMASQISANLTARLFGDELRLSNTDRYLSGAGCLWRRARRMRSDPTCDDGLNLDPWSRDFQFESPARPTELRARLACAASSASIENLRKVCDRCIYKASTLAGGLFCRFPMQSHGICHIETNNSEDHVSKLHNLGRRERSLPCESFKCGSEYEGPCSIPYPGVQPEGGFLLNSSATRFAIVLIEMS